MKTKAELVAAVAKQNLLNEERSFASRLEQADDSIREAINHLAYAAAHANQKATKDNISEMIRDLRQMRNFAKTLSY